MRSFFLLLLLCVSTSSRAQSLLLYTSPWDGGTYIWNVGKRTYYPLPVQRPYARLAGYAWEDGKLVCTWEREGRLESVAVTLPDSIRVPSRTARLSMSRQTSMDYPAIFSFGDHTLRLGHHLTLLKEGRPVWGDTADGTLPVHYLQRLYTNPVLSPDANSIAVVYYSEGKAKSLREDHWNLLEVDVATGGQTRIAKDGRSPAYSPDGKYLLFTDRRGKLRIYNRRTQELLSVLHEPGFREGYWLEQR